MHVCEIFHLCTLINLFQYALQNIHCIYHTPLPNHHRTGKYNMSGSTATKIGNMHAGREPRLVKQEMRVNKFVPTVIHTSNYTSKINGLQISVQKWQPESPQASQ